MKQSILTLLLMFLPKMASAFDAEINGIYYNFNTSDNTASVTFLEDPYSGNNRDAYSGALEIPSEVTYNDVVYNVTSIGNRAFYNCSGLTSIILPSSVTTIHSLAFYGCSSLASINVPNSVTSIESQVFLYCRALTSITVEADNPKYDSRNNCNAIIETKSNTLILGCKNTTIPNDITTIGYGAFFGCKDLVSIDIPNSVSEISYEAFSSCTGLTSIVIPNSVEIIDGRAFDGCISLTSIIIPKSVTRVGSESPFNGCSNLNSIVVEADNNIYDSRDNCNAVIETSTNKLIAGCKNTIIPNSVTSIGYNSMCSFRDLTSIKIPNSVTSIEFGAFQNCGFTSITIPSSVTSIGECAFGYCNNLREIISEIKSPFEIRDRVFSVYSTATLIVPKGTKSAYQSTAGWNNFVNIKEAEADNSGKAAEPVDLGLSVKWASYNVGAEAPEEMGNHYAWGELSPKTEYSSSTYNFYDNGYTKYGSVDNKYRLEAEDDVAQQTWGGKWRIPTSEELKELKEKCTFTMTELNGVPVTKVEGPNGNYIYFPFPGNFTNNTLFYENSVGSYWSSDLDDDSYAKDIDFREGNISINGDTRYHGQSIRPVYDSKVEAIDLGLSVKWASFNVGAEAPEEMGNHYAWGELSPKTEYSSSTYKFYDNGYTKYGSVDNKYRLEAEDDVALQTWGGKWRIPTSEELKELKEKCTFTITELNGVTVTKVEGPNGNYIYFPFPGNFTNNTLFYENSVGSYWSSDLEDDSYAKDIDFREGNVSINGDTRYHGQSIRPVYDISEKEEKEENDEEQVFYPRRTVMEEATGTWCGWCVRGIETMERLKKDYPDNFIGIALHSGDEMKDIQNYSGLTSTFKSWPSCYINRNSSEPGSVSYTTDIINYIEQNKNNAIAKIDIEASYTDDSRTTVYINTKTTFGFSSNTTNHKIAYVVVEDKVGPYLQNNAYSGNSSYDTPSYYMYDWVHKDSRVEVLYNDVARAIYDDAYGVNGSIPNEIKKGEAYDYNYKLQLTSNIDNKDNIRIITLLLDNESGEILNAAQCNISAPEKPKYDPNDDGELSPEDIMAIINLILTGQYDSKADLNNDGIISIADVIILVNSMDS